MQTRSRTLLKAILWNVIGLIMMTLIGWVATGSLGFGGRMAVINTGIGLVVYLVYERIWDRVSWGRYGA